MAGFEGLVTPNPTQDAKSVDGKKVSAEGTSVPKEGPSLFDSMMAQLTRKDSSEAEGETEGTTKQNIGTPQTKQSGTKASEVVGSQTGSSQNSGGASLFDKMVSQSTQQANTMATNPQAKDTQNPQTQDIQNPQAKVVNTKGDGTTVSSKKKQVIQTPQNTIKTADIKTNTTTNLDPKLGEQKVVANTNTEAKNLKNPVTAQESQKQNGSKNLANLGEKVQKQVSSTSNTQAKQTIPNQQAQTIDSSKVQKQVNNTPNTQAKQTIPNQQVQSVDSTKVEKKATDTSNTVQDTTQVKPKQTKEAVPGSLKNDTKTTIDNSNIQKESNPNSPKEANSSEVQKQIGTQIEKIQNKAKQTNNPSQELESQKNQTPIKQEAKVNNSTQNITDEVLTNKQNTKNTKGTAQVKTAEEKTQNTKVSSELTSLAGIKKAKRTDTLNQVETNGLKDGKTNIGKSTQVDILKDEKTSSNQSLKETSPAKVLNTNQSTTNQEVLNTKNQNTNKIVSPQVGKNNQSALDSNKAPLNTEVKADNTKGEKKSLADSLISSATATALADKNSKESTQTNSEVKSDNKAVAQPNKQTTTIAQNNTPVNLSANENSQTAQQATQNIPDTSSVQDLKSSEQVIVDKKVENKTIDTKNSDLKQQIAKNEQDHSLKLATASAASSKANSTTSNTVTTNQELASGLANIRDTAKSDLVSINDNELKSTLKDSMKKEDNKLADKKQQSGNSLLDKMVKDASSANANESKQLTESLGAKDQFVQKDLPLFATAGYLHDQKKRNDIANMMKKNEGVLQAQNAKNVSDVKNSAQTLGLNAGETEVIEEVVQKEEVRVQNSREDLLKRMAFDNNVGRKLHNTNHQIQTNENIVAKASALTNTTEEQAVEVAVSAEATQTIENRIVGARQSLRSMMSDVARQMAQNYKPPLTAFRINLNPSGLGNIAVMIKSEQNNGVSISLNMSNTNTLETFVDNQSQLRAALTRNFETETSFNLDFGMQQDNNSNQNQGDRSNQNDSSSNQAKQTNIIAEQHSTEEVISQANYM